MKPKKNLYDFEKTMFDTWHFKICEEPVNKDDYVSLEDFSVSIDEPLEVYEKHIRTIEEERTVHHIIVVDNIEKKEAVEEMEFFSKNLNKIFIGEYDSDMQKEITKYIAGKGLSHLRKDEMVMPKLMNGHNGLFSYDCQLYDRFHTLGFYFRREGLLRGCLKESYYDGMITERLSGSFKAFELLLGYLDKAYIQHIYGNEGWTKLCNYYQKAFIDNYEHGISFMKVMP